MWTYFQLGASVLHSGRFHSSGTWIHALIALPSPPTMAWGYSRLTVWKKKVQLRERESGRGKRWNIKRALPQLYMQKETLDFWFHLQSLLNFLNLCPHRSLCQNKSHGCLQIMTCSWIHIVIIWLENKWIIMLMFIVFVSPLFVTLNNSLAYYWIQQIQKLVSIPKNKTNETQWMIAHTIQRRHPFQPVFTCRVECPWPNISALDTGPWG